MVSSHPPPLHIASMSGWEQMLETNQMWLNFGANISTWIAYTRQWPNAGVMLDRRRRWWANIALVLSQFLVFAIQLQIIVFFISNISGDFLLLLTNPFFHASYLTKITRWISTVWNISLQRRDTCSLSTRDSENPIMCSALKTRQTRNLSRWGCLYSQSTPHPI